MTDTVSRWEVLSRASCAVETGRGGGGRGGWGERPVHGLAWQNWGGGCSHNLARRRNCGQPGVLKTAEELVRWGRRWGLLEGGSAGSRGWVSREGGRATQGGWRN